MHIIMRSMSEDESAEGLGDTHPTDLKVTSLRGKMLSPFKRPVFSHVAVFLLYQAFWLAWMWPKVIRSPGDRLLSSVGSEASVFIWSLEWWARAVTHASNPLLTHAVWAPTGMNLAWVTTVPGPAILVAPLTRAAGATVSFNTLVLLTPPLTAWTTYLLAHRVTRRALPAIAAGFLFGFSPVVMREIQQGHLNLSMLFLLPLGAYLILRRLEGSMGRVSFVLLLAAVLIGQFSIFIEIFATATVIGVLIGVSAWVLGPPAMRKRLVDCGILVATSYAIVAVVVSPYLYTAFTHPSVSKPADFAGLTNGARGLRDLIHFVVPSRAIALGPPVYKSSGAVHFWYFGLPLLVVLTLFWVRGRRDWKARTLAVAFIICVVLALGPNMPVHGYLIPLPWKLFGSLPLLGRARPGRLVIFAFLIASVSVALWAAQVRGRSRPSLFRWGLVCLAVVAIMPKYWADVWTTDVRMPAFFKADDYKGSLCPDETLLAVDGKSNTQAFRQVYWQTEFHLSFRNVTWYRGFVPDDYPDRQLGLQLATGDLRPGDGPRLREFIARHGVTALVIVNVAPRVTAELASMLGATPREVGGVTVIRLSPCPSR